MRAKKHKAQRMEACGELLVREPGALKGRWSADGAREVWLELGCGKGKFICGMAERYRDVCFVAIERYGEVLVIALEKAKSRGYTNIRFIDGDIKDAQEWFIPGELSRIYLNFSDPWPKHRHWHRRLTHPNHLAIYKELLASGGELHFKTDNRELFDYSEKKLSACGFDIKTLTYDLHADRKLVGDNIITEYERIFMDEGKAIHMLTAKLR